MTQQQRSRRTGAKTISIYEAMGRRRLGGAVARAFRASSNGDNITGKWRPAADAFDIDNSISIDEILAAMNLWKRQQRRQSQRKRPVTTWRKGPVCCRPAARHVAHMRYRDLRLVDARRPPLTSWQGQVGERFAKPIRSVDFPEPRGQKSRPYTSPDIADHHHQSRGAGSPRMWSPHYARIWAPSGSVASGGGLGRRKICELTSYSQLQPTHDIAQ
jgi:hypothetical protein